MKIVLQGEVVTIDREDYPIWKLYTWRILHAKNGLKYVQNSQGELLHRLIMGLPDSYTDHRDGNGLNNSKSNLRKATNAQNQQNVRKVRGVSKYKNVCWRKSDQRWVVRISFNGERIYIGAFIDEDEAGKAAIEADKNFYGEFSIYAKA